jgi:hypothetical protein
VVIVRVTATPEDPEDGQRLADEILHSMAAVARPGQTEERQHPRSAAG